MKKLFVLWLLGCILGITASAFAQSERPEWQSLELTNAMTGEVFSLASLGDMTLYVETMATWCSNCRKQLQNASEAKAMLNEDDKAVFVMLSVEGNLADERLADYAEREGFDFIFAVATPELLTALVDTFGRRVTSPPSTPHFVIYPDGTTSELETGFETPDEILAAIGVSVTN